jgi:hypothetical protein
MRTLLIGWGRDAELGWYRRATGTDELVLIQVRDLRRLTRQLSDPTDQPGGPWEFSDAAPPPGWTLPAGPSSTSDGAAPVGLGVRGRWS